ncbi:MAG: glycosyltransferase [Fervidobacterium sp.]|uniref:glycosyltransferase n=1 Tax=Fervidobacterium sp. TaxID=1871331 RepID=UPI00404A5E93
MKYAKKSDSVKVIATLHRFPTTFVRRQLLRQFSKHVECLIVHSDYQKSELERIGVTNVVVIEYPALLSNKFLLDDQLDERNESKDFCIISFIGALSKEKGLDIFLASLDLLEQHVKDKILVQIKGRESDISKDFVESLLIKSGVRYSIKAEYVSDEEFIETILKSDALVIPYRKNFVGSSGPMTEAMYNSIPVIAPNYKVLAIT